MIVRRTRHHAPPIEGSLGALIERRRAEYGESYGDIARRAGLSKPYIYKLAASPSPMGVPRPATLTALARGLQTTEGAVLEAALVTADVATTSTETADPSLGGIVAALETLDHRDLKAVERLVQALAQDPAKTSRTGLDTHPR